MADKSTEVSPFDKKVSRRWFGRAALLSIAASILGTATAKKMSEGSERYEPNFQSLIFLSRFLATSKDQQEAKTHVKQLVGLFANPNFNCPKNYLVSLQISYGGLKDGIHVSENFNVTVDNKNQPNVPIQTSYEKVDTQIQRNIPLTSPLQIEEVTQADGVSFIDGSIEIIEDQQKYPGNFPPSLIQKGLPIPDSYSRQYTYIAGHLANTPGKDFSTVLSETLMFEKQGKYFTIGNYGESLYAVIGSGNDSKKIDVSQEEFSFLNTQLK